MQLNLSPRLKVDLFPIQGLIYFCVSLFVVILVALLVEKIAIPYLEDQGKIVSCSWKKDDKLIWHFLRQRNFGNWKCPVWCSEGIPVSLKKISAKRILIIGDSYVEGSGSANINTIWWRQLARELCRRGYNDVEVVAAGRAGASTRQELEWAKVLIPAYSSDLVIWGYVINDPEEIDPQTGKNIVAQFCSPKENKLKNDIQSSILGRLFPQLIDQLLSIRLGILSKRLSGKEYGYENGDWENELIRGRNFEQYKKTVADLGQFMHESNLPMFVMTLPGGVFENYYKLHYDPVKPLFKKAGIRFIDIFPAYKAAFQYTHPYWSFISPANGHAGPLATHFFATSAADILEKDYPSVLGGKSRSHEMLAINDWVPPSIHFKQLDKTRFGFLYPCSDSEMLSMPIRKPFVQLNLKDAMKLAKVQLWGPNLSAATLYLTSEDPATHFDDGSIERLNRKQGSTVSWLLNKTHNKINTIRINAEFNGKNHYIEINAIPAQVY